MKLLITAGLAGLLLCGCGPDKKSVSKKEPAKVEAHPDETDIFRLVLTPKAVSRLQISTVPARMQSVPRTRSVGAEMVIPDGHRVPVTAPLTGTLMKSQNAPGLTAGRVVESDEVLLKLLPLLPPEREVPNAPERVQMANARASLVSAQIQADGDAKRTQAEVDAAKIAYDRARQLFADKAGSQRNVDETEATLNIATKSLEAALERKALLDKLTLEAEGGEVPVVSIRSPTPGIVQTISTQPGQVVTAGAVLCEVVNLDSLWVRVPVYAGLVQEMETQRPASVSRLTGDSMVRASPVSAPPTADPLSASVDVYYSIDNKTGGFHPGERVMVHIPLHGERESLVVPRAAILRDINGTAWVYVQSEPQVFRRVRTAVSFTTDDLAVLSLGPEVGSPVVVDGAAELFGTEFGAKK